MRASDAESAECAALIGKIRTKRPIIHHNTNYVTANDCANITLAIGASPIMADDPREAEAVTGSAHALVLNMGTPSPARIEAAMISGRTANAIGIPVVFDPVGIGVSDFRAGAAREILGAVACAVIRCNASEILSLANGSPGAGLDATEAERAANICQIAKTEATKYKCVVVVTGASDVVTDGERTTLVLNGHESMSGITGTGCMCDSVIASFCATGANPFTAAICGTACMGMAGEMAFERTGCLGTGSLRAAIFDAMSGMTGKVFGERMRLSGI
ncbi:MAG: hydroxyethylthiazole kinase [Synergistaceae bacterium]|jgi:hydroxyethylthiazole kinase|nr:hydroxyethylthiazole kinase [Synergistaceae bacterium]